MTGRAAVVEASPATPTSRPGVLVFRKCACGESAGSGECDDCRKKKPSGIQTKLKVSEPGDALELEADRVADQVLRMPAEGAPKDPGSLGHSPAFPVANAPAGVQRALSRGGRALDRSLQNDMGRRFGHDFSRVRVHTDAEASGSAESLRAHAYTIGNHVVFGANRFSPDTGWGRRLIAHEFAHVVQQTGTGDRPATGIEISQKADPAILRKGFESTIQVCHQVLESRKFQVSQGGVRVVMLLNPVDSSVVNCRDFNFGVTLTRSEDWWPDDRIGTCEAMTGGHRSFSFANLPSGTYYLAFWRVFDHPYCCLEGDIQVFDEAISGDSSGCRKDKDLSVMDVVHGALDIAGFIPGLGAIPDGVNALIYAAEGDWANAGISAVAMVPLFGDGAKLVVKGGKEMVEASGKTVLKMGKQELAAGLKAEKAAAKKIEAEAAEQATKRTEKEAAEATEKQTAKKEADVEAESSTKEKDKKKKQKSSKCSEALQAELYAAVEAACHGKRGCNLQTDTCATATAKVAAGYACTSARERFQQRCWSPKDPGYEGHMLQISQAYASLRECIDIMHIKCGDRNK